ncbi:MAG: saccharopine dehydrogenase NADP-binding domain-containing protein [Bacteroidetes bacterium]|nr:saccharopine dehydrogenase NADP-binding domain-containing protein [Bacteroidota bacterium]
MKRILILGAGLVANPMVQYLLGKGYQVSVASNTPDRAAEMVKDHANGRVIRWEAEDKETLDTLVAKHDLTVSLLPYRFHVDVAYHCLKHKKNLVTTSYVKPEMRALDEEAREAGIILLNEIGLDPGVDHMSAMRIIDKIHEKEGAVLEFYSICGALPAPEAADNPFRYKFSWSPKGVVLAGNNDALYLRNGEKVSVPTQNLFRDIFEVDFPEVGKLDVYPNRDSLAYQEIYGIPEARTVYRGTFRYKGWCETLDAIKRLDLISPEIFNMRGMTFANMVLFQIKKLDPKFIQHPASSIRQQVASYLSLPENAYAIEALDWLGLFRDTPMGRGLDSTFEVTSDLMIGKMGLGPTERDMVVLQHTFLAAYSDGRKEVIRSRMLDFGTPATDTSIARTVALPAAIAAEMILEGKITEKGVHIPVIPGIYNPVLDRLEHMNIRMVEEYGLPLSENIS